MKSVFISSFAVVVGFIAWILGIGIFMLIADLIIKPSGFFAVVGSLIAGYFSSLFATLFLVRPLLKFLIKSKQSIRTEFAAIILLVLSLFLFNLYLMFVMKIPNISDKPVIIAFSVTSLIPFFMLLNEKD